MDLQDYFAVLLRQKGAGPELTALAKRLMDQTGGTRPEAWVAMSLHADLRGDKERAVDFIDKALSVAPSHVLAYHVKGTLLLAQGREEAAAAAFVQASALRRDIYSCKGLVDAYLAQHKFKEALSAAKAGEREGHGCGDATACMCSKTKSCLGDRGNDPV